QEVALGDFFPKLVNFNLVEKPDDFVLREILGGLRRLVVLDKAVDDAPDMLDVVTLLGAALSLTLIGAGDIGRLARAAAAEILPVNRLWQRFPAPFAAAFGELVETLGIRMVGIGLHPEMEFFISRGVGGRMHIALELDVPEKNIVLQSGDQLVGPCPFAGRLMIKNRPVARDIGGREDGGDPVRNGELQGTQHNRGQDRQNDGNSETVSHYRTPYVR